MVLDFDRLCVPLRDVISSTEFWFGPDILVRCQLWHRISANNEADQIHDWIEMHNLKAKILLSAVVYSCYLLLFFLFFFIIIISWNLVLRLRYMLSGFQI